MKRSTDPRHLARILALQELFSQYFDNGNMATDQMPIDELMSVNEVDTYNKELHDKIIKGVPENLEEIDKMIAEYAPQWPISQMKLVDLQILRIAIYEGFIGKITPPKVSIDEAIEIAKDFGGEISGKFVNGILGAIYEKYKQEENNDK